MPLSSPFALRRAAGLRASLAGLLLQALARDANTFLLVGVGRTQRANVRGHLADLPFVRAADHEVRLLVDRDLNTLGNLKLHGVLLPDPSTNRFALQLLTL